MLRAYVALSYFLYFLPVVFLFVARARKQRPLAAFALDVPLALGLDLVLMLLLTRFLPLDGAVLTSRWVWGGGFVANLLIRWRCKWQLPQVPDWLNWRSAWHATFGMLSGALLSIFVSRAVGLWDRQWHIPLVSSLRGQRLPFLNVYTPPEGLYYHFSGDVVAAALQVFSWSHVHASLAISMSHDVAFAAIGLFLAMFWRHLGLRAIAATPFVIAAVLFTGPLAMFTDLYHRENGYSFPGFISWALRPHVPFSALFVLQFAATVLLRVFPGRDGEHPLGVRDLRLCLLTATLALTVTDETSLGLVALGSGMLWLFCPTIFGDRRRSGFVTIFILVLAIAASAVVFIGAIGPGAIRYPVQFVAPRSPGFYVPSLALSTWEGLKKLLEDCGIMLALMFGLWQMALSARNRVYIKCAAFGTFMFVLGVGLLCTWDHNGSGLESHRFAFAPMILLPFLFISAMSGALASETVGRSLGLPLIPLAAFVLLVPVVTSFEWVLSGVAVAQSDGGKGFVATDNFYDMDCVEVAGARHYEKSRLTLVDSQAFFHYSGCRPIFALGPLVGIDNQVLKIGWPRLNRDALSTLDQTITPNTDRLRIVCASSPQPNDFVCERAKAQLDCPQTGRDFQLCQADGEQRKKLLTF